MSANHAIIPSLGQARLAGFLYLVIIVCGIGSEVFIRSGLIVDGDAAATAANILESDGLFRLGFVADAIMLLSDVAIAVLFYVLLKPVNQTLALIAAAFRLTQASILGFNLLNYYAAALLMNGTVYLNGLELNQLQVLASLFLDLHSHGYDLGLIFFGLSNLILGYLLIRADYFPTFFGYGLIAAALVYLAGSFTRFVFPDYAGLMEPLYLIPLLAELAFALYLLVKGVRDH
ncbi:DUF4386 domain-containing protein [Thiomicrorhabdus chilensis]|uniref:DUF4386 domain-containing protein n=1 Tax=Thiomicrorhabdus chilensis TaxID=63656 RepID=UPI0004234953|nr:DUF4386 domain-containing protein [Thiomicrorhabdus chilensis]